MYQLVSVKFSGTEKWYTYYLSPDSVMDTPYLNARIPKGMQYGKQMYQSVTILKGRKCETLPPKVYSRISVYGTLAYLH